MTTSNRTANPAPASSTPAPTPAPAGRRRRSPAGRRTTVAGGAYVAAWLVGLALAPASPEPDAPAAEIGAFYADNGSAVLLSSSFVHGAAAVALAAFALSVVRATGTGGGLRRAVVGTGLVAAALSLGQVGLAALAVSSGGAETRADLFAGINLVDVLKIAFLAGFVAVTTTAAARAGCAPRWLRVLAAVLVPTLVAGSAAFVVGSTTLVLVLTASLLGLLVWAGATAVVVGRAAR